MIGIARITELIGRCGRLLTVSRKPTDEEFQKVAKVTAIGIVVIGVLGTIISFIFTSI